MLLVCNFDIALISNLMRIPNVFEFHGGFLLYTRANILDIILVELWDFSVLHGHQFHELVIFHAEGSLNFIRGTGDTTFIGGSIFE